MSAVTRWEDCKKDGETHSVVLFTPLVGLLESYPWEEKPCELPYASRGRTGLANATDQGLAVKHPSGGEFHGAGQLDRRILRNWASTCSVGFSSVSTTATASAARLA